MADDLGGFFDDIPDGQGKPQEPSFFDDVPDGPVDTSWTQRGRQFATSATEAVATAPEGIAVSLSSLQKHRKDNASEMLDERQRRIELGLEALRTNPDMPEQQRRGIQAQIDAMRRGMQPLEEAKKSPITPARDRDIYSYGDTIRNAVTDTIGAPDPRDQSFGGKFASGAGSLFGIAASSIAASAATGNPFAGVLVGTGQGIAMNQSQVYKEALDAGADEETALQASDWAALVGATEIIPIGRALKLLPASVRKEVTSTVLKRIIELGKSGAEEGIQEYLSQVANNLVAQSYYDPKRGWSEGATEAALIGSILGVGTGTVGVALEPKIEQVSEGGASDEQKDAISGANTRETKAESDPAVSQAITEQPVPSATERAKQVAAKRRAAQQEVQTPPAPAASPNAGATEPPTASVGQESAAPAPTEPASNEEITANVPEEPAAPQKSELFDQAVEAVRGYNIASLGHLRGRLKISDAKARQLMFELEDAGIVSKPDARGNRTIIRDEVTPESNVSNAEITANVPPDSTFVPETPETIDAQRQALVAGKKKAVMYSPDEPVPELPGEGVVRGQFKIDGKPVVIDFNPKLTNYGKIQQAIRKNKLNELLDLGPVSKQEAAESAAAGSPPAAVVERTPEGTEVKAAAGTVETAPEQVQALEETKTAPENTVEVEAPEQVIEDRTIGGRRVLEDVSPEGVAKRQAAAEARAKQEADRLAKEQAAAEEAAKEADKAAKKAKNLEELTSKVENKAFGSIEEEALSRATVGGSNLQDQDKAAIVRGATISKEAFDAGSKVLPEIVANGQDLKQLATVLNNILTDARTKFIDAQKELKTAAKTRTLTEKAKRALGTRTKGDYPTVTGHVIWLSEAASLKRRIDAMNGDPKTFGQLFSDVNDFLNNSIALKDGDDAPLREKRRQQSAEIASSRASDAMSDRKELGGVQDMEFTDSVRDEEDAAGRAPEAEADAEVTAEPNEDLATTTRLPSPDSTRVSPDEPVEEGVDYNVGRAAKAPVIVTKKRRTVYKSETNPSGAAARELRSDDVLQEVTLAEAFERASASPGNAMNRAIIDGVLNRLRKKIGDTPILVVKQSSLDDMYPNTKKGNVNGYYDPVKKHIVVSESFVASGEFDASLLAHEGIHAYLQDAIASSEALRKDIQQILDLAKSKAKRNYRGLLDVHEFISEALSSPEFQNFLASIEVTPAMAAKFQMPSGTKGSNLWRSFVGTVRRYLGVANTPKVMDALSYAMHLGNLAEQVAADRQSTTDFEKEMARRGFMSEGREPPNWRRKDVDVARAELEAALATDDFLGYSNAEAAMNAVIRRRNDGKKEALRKLGMSQKTEELMDRYFQALEARADRAKRRHQGEVFPDDILHKVSLGDALGRVLDVTPGRPFLRDANRIVLEKVTNRILEVIPDIEVKVVSQTALDALFPDKAKGSVRGFYDAKFNHILIQEGSYYNGKFDTRLIVHEAVHAYLYDAVESDLQLKRDIQEILDFAKNNAFGDQKNAYGFTDVQEFIAEALSNRDFQNMLLETKLPSSIREKYGKTVDSLWGALVDAIRKHLGLARESTDALSYVMKLVDRAEQRRPEVRSGQSTDIVFSLSEGRRNFAKELTDAGIPKSEAAEIAKAIEEEMADPNYAAIEDVDQLIKDLVAEFKRPEVTAESKEKKTKQAKAEVDTKAKKIVRDIEKSADALADEAYLKALDEYKPGRVPGVHSSKFLYLLMNNQLSLLADKYFGRNNNPVRRIADLVEKRRTAKSRILEELAPVPEALLEAERKYNSTKKGQAVWEKFVTLAHDSTMAQVHPDLPLDADEHKHLGKNSMNGKWGKKQHPKLAAAYNALPDDLKALYRQTRDILTETQNRIALKLTENVLEAAGHKDAALAKRFFEGAATPADRALVGEFVSDYIERVGELAKIQGPYFNLARRGEWVVNGTYQITAPSNAKKIEDNIFEFKTQDEAEKFAEAQDLRPKINRVLIDPKTGKTFFTDEDGMEVKASKNDPDAEERFRVTVQNQHTEFFMSKKEAESRRAELSKAGLKMRDVESKKDDFIPPNGDMLSRQFRQLAATVGKRSSLAGLTDSQKKEVKNTLNEISLQFLGSTRIQSHRLPRRYVQGASKDLTLNTFDYVDSASGYLAKLETQPALEDALRQMDKGVQALSGRGVGLGTGARQVAKEMARRVENIDYDMDAGVAGAVANRLMLVNFVNHLMSPFYTVLQVMQVPMLSLPTLSGEYGVAPTSLNLLRAYRDVGSIQTVAKGVAATAKAAAAISTPGKTYTDYIKSRLKNADEKRMIDDLVSLGIVDADAGFDVNRLTRKDSMIVRGVDASLNYLGEMARAAPQSVEAINRMVTALAAFRMAKRKGASYETALRAAQEATEQTQFNMSGSNAAPVFKNPVGRLLLQFKKYGQNVYFLMYRNFARAIRPMEKGDRSKGVRTLLYLAATHTAMAGMMGLPIEPLKLAVLALNGLGLIDWGWDDAEDEIEKKVKEVLGVDDLSVEVLMYGLPRLADINLSSRVGLSSLLLYGEPGDVNDKESVKAWLFDLVAGPSTSSVTDAVSGTRLLLDGKFGEAFEKLIPVKGVSDVISAYNDLDEGKMDASDAVLRGIGVQSARQARIQEKRSDMFADRRELRREKSEIISAWMSASTSAERARVIARMREFNQKAGKKDRLSRKMLENMRRRDEELYRSE